MSNKHNMLIMRILCVVFVLGSYLLANSNSSILNLASISWGAVSGCLLAPYLLGLYWKRATKVGAYTGLITALLVLIVGLLTLEGGFKNGNIPVLSSLAIIAPIITMTIASLLSPSFDKAHIDYIFNE